MGDAKTVLVVGATGATGRLLVAQLLGRGLRVRAVARPGTPLPAQLHERDRLSVIRADLLAMTDGEMTGLVGGCDCIVSCLGHNLSWKGIFGRPRRLVRDAVQRLSTAVIASRPGEPVRFVLMNSAGCRNADASEPLSPGHRAVIALLRLLLPPHADNEQAADYLRTELGQSNPALQWVVVRPDSLKDAEAVTAYATYPSPTRSALFDPGATSRINVAHFIAALVADDGTWRQWVGRMPVIYDR